MLFASLYTSRFSNFFDSNLYSIFSLACLSATTNSNGNVSIEGNGRLKIYDMTGKLILMPYVNNNYTWETDELSSGIYFIISEISKIKVTLLI